jgi:3'-5' exoribonuclease 1
VSPLSLDEFLALDEVVLVDCEFACWADSMATAWSDPARPPELIEIGLARYRRDTGTTTATFESLVRPGVNPRLSDYCRRLTGIAQADVDAAPGFADVMRGIAAWLGGEAPTCGWGPIDRAFVAREAAALGVRDPFGAAPHGDVRALLQAVLGRPPGTRDEMRARWGLAPNDGRHRALSDAIDLAQFCALIRRRRAVS